METEERCKGHHKTCMMGFGLVVSLIGLLWLGGELGWFAFTFPWLPLLVLLFGLKMLFVALKH